MPRYMTQFTYTADAWAKLVKNPEDRSGVLGELLDNMGGRLIAFYYGRGEYDGVFLYETPDEATANATIFAAVSPGHVKAIKTTELFTVDETIEALLKARSVTYRGPGE
jgi:uncharacterized protein with GYD domain